MTFLDRRGLPRSSARFIMAMAVLLPATGLGLGQACHGSQSPQSAMKYDNSLFTLGVNAWAKELCSCLFVTGQTEDFCRAFARIPQIPDSMTRVRIDSAGKKVRVRALLGWSGSAHWVDDRSGCVLD